MKKVSVVIPVYNVELYLEQCLNSVITQTYKNIEIICIDDGSTDNSLDILRAYERSDKRIIIISRENRGLLASRIEGLEKASGEYILNLDADDYLEVNAIEKLITYLSIYCVDIVRFGYYINENTRAKLNYQKGIILQKDFEPFFYELFFERNVLNTAWGEFFKKEKFDLTGKIDIEITMGEDIEYNLHLYPFITSIMLVKDRLYHYRTNAFSMTRRKNIEIIKNNIESAYRAYRNLFCSLYTFDIQKIEFYEKILATRLINEIYYLEIKLISFENTSNKDMIMEFINKTNSLIKKDGFYNKTSVKKIFLSARRHKLFNCFMYNGNMLLSYMYVKIIYNSVVLLRRLKNEISIG